MTDLDLSTDQHQVSGKLPHSVDAEKAVLGSILRDSETLSVVEGVLEPRHFFIDSHRKIYEAIFTLSSAGESVDIVTVAEKLRELQEDGKQLGPSYLVDLTENCPVTQNVEHYAKIVRNHFYRRGIITSCEDVIQGAKSFDGSIESFIEKVEKQFLAIASEYDSQGIVTADRVLESTIEDIQKKLESDGSLSGVTTGFNDLDALTGGLQPSDLIILAARPGMGKTALVLNVATNAVLAGKSVVVFSLEMSKEQLMARVLSSVARVDSSRLRKGDLSDEEQDRLMEGARRIYECKDALGIDETPGISLMELRSRCRRFHKENGVDMIIIDYLQLMSGSSQAKSESREREISEISMGLKNLAKELGVPVIALAQLNRGPDSRPDKRPKLSDLRESGSMEQDADMIFFVYRDEYYNPNSEMAGIAELLVAKNRHGSLTTIKLAYQPNYVSFQNLFHESDDA
ncbi:replicative DNA helicase [Pseudobacteriovorax antillogorgiicola]|uniref:Replicative DNA helicase n=1 Tax=Pseudobacteriovorax antillogorgiicola TaxID=1513793 RepID=A0A1Y6B7U6_9BACT|nr:replicative DNA helicase [Pseudobacteriovorax antillogorgiicola]TCS59285.1 primary replicative DNA helicase [Pseudobacteriovorax antillogorgiicola]SME89731.1 primary replicative DNA helicase [Pseudobacteriovorax antillogorgiicola]